MMSEPLETSNPPAWLEPKTVESISKIVLAFVALVGFFWGMYKYFDAREQEAQVRRIEATRPFLEKQLQLYTEATQVASQIAAHSLLRSSQHSLSSVTEVVETNRTTNPEERFWQLYYGELVMVEDLRVAEAMSNFRSALRSNQRDGRQLRNLSLELAHACRNSLAESWGVEMWRLSESDSEPGK